jgi:hypothetical protein
MAYSYSKKLQIVSHFWTCHLRTDLHIVWARCVQYHIRAVMKDVQSYHWRWRLSDWPSIWQRMLLKLNPPCKLLLEDRIMQRWTQQWEHRTNRTSLVNSKQCDFYRQRFAMSMYYVIWSSISVKFSVVIKLYGCDKKQRVLWTILFLFKTIWMFWKSLWSYPFQFDIDISSLQYHHTTAYTGSQSEMLALLLTLAISRKDRF